MKNRNKWINGIGVGIALVGLATSAGCSDDDNSSGGNDMGSAMDMGGSEDATSTDTADTGGTEDSSTQPGNASIRAIHLSPDAPAVDIFVNGGSPAAVSNLPFPDSTPFVQLPAGTYTFDIAPTGATVDDAVLTVADLELAAGKNYTAVAFNKVAEIEALALEDDLSAPDAGLIRLRAIHTASGVGQVDIWNIPAEGAPAPLFTDVDFGAATAYVDVPEGAYSLGFDVDNDATPDLMFDVPSLPAGTIANVFAVSDETDVYLIAQFVDGTTAKIVPKM